jgi:hypothetical protein
MAFVPPTLSEFLAAYPEFEDVDATVIQNALTAGGRNVDDSWIEADFAPAIMLYAAHVLTFNQNTVDSGGTGGRITSESLGPISVSYEKLGTQFDENFLGATSYGTQFTRLAYLNRGGPRIV